MTDCFIKLNDEPPRLAFGAGCPVGLCVRIISSYIITVILKFKKNKNKNRGPGGGVSVPPSIHHTPSTRKYAHGKIIQYELRHVQLLYTYNKFLNGCIFISSNNATTIDQYPHQLFIEWDFTGLISSCREYRQILIFFGR